MKTNFTSDEIAHIWAHKSAERGSSPSAMSFEGDRFYSYGAVIGRHIKRAGKPAVILSDGKYSDTTSKHQNMLEAAVNGQPVFHYRGGGDLNPTGAQLFAYAMECAAGARQRAETARTRGGYYLAEAPEWMERAREVAEFFKLKRKVDEATVAKLRKASEGAARRAAAKQERERKEAQVKQAAAFEAWKRGKRDGHFSSHAFPVAFRVEGKELVSSMGARVPLSAAKTAHRFALRHRADGWQRNGETCPVGAYEINSISAAGVVAGCHTITWEEIERLSAVLSLAK